MAGLFNMYIATSTICYSLISMSNIYIHEPPTHGKVLMVTSLGELDIELWSKEAPLACRNFVQLCRDGYYTGTAFHRVVPQFMAQGGDKSGTGDGGESIYGAPFKLESHQRLRFSRRGLLATAGANPNDNTSQFFFTLGAHEHLNKKHTIFGQVTGDTKYNLLRFNDVPTDKNDRPLNPPRITKIQILSNPFPDLDTNKQDSIISATSSNEIKSKEKNRKSVKNINLLSFGDELEDGEDSLLTTSSEALGKWKSGHDFEIEGLESYQPPAMSSDTEANEVTRFVKPGSSAQLIAHDTHAVDDEQTNSYTETQSIKKSRQKSKDKNSSVQPNKPLTKEDIQIEYEKIRKELRKQSKRSVAKESLPEENNTSSLDPYLIQRIEYLKKSKRFKLEPASRQANTLAMLSKFSSKLKMVRNIAENVFDSDKSETDEVKEDQTAGDAAWMSRTLKFEGENAVPAKDVNVTSEDRWDIYDPRNSMNKRRREENRKQKQKKEK